MRTTMLLVFTLPLLLLARPDVADAQDAARQRGTTRAAPGWPRSSLLCFDHLRVGDVDNIARSLVPEGVIVHTETRTNCLVLVGIDDARPLRQLLDRLEQTLRSRPVSRRSASSPARDRAR